MILETTLFIFVLFKSKCLYMVQATYLSMVWGTALSAGPWYNIWVKTVLPIIKIRDGRLGILVDANVVETVFGAEWPVDRGFAGPVSPYIDS